MTARELLRKAARDRVPDDGARCAPLFHWRGDVALREVAIALLSHPGACARWLDRADVALREEVVL